MGNNKFLVITLIISVAAVLALITVISRLTRDISTPPPELTLSLIEDQAYLETAKAEPGRVKDKILVEAAKMLLSEIHTVTDNKHRNFVPGDFERVIPVIEFMLALDPENGHAIYFRGEVYRLLEDDIHFIGYFRQYLRFEDSAGSRFSGVTDPRLCYETPHGYCEQRTAWISQLLANYYYTKGIDEPDEYLKSESYNLAREYIRNARSHFPAGFPASSVTLSTADLENKLIVNRIR